jgi:hypothetical protein
LSASARFDGGKAAAPGAKTVRLELRPGVLRDGNGSPFQLSLTDWYSTNDYFRGVVRTFPWLFALFVEMMPAYTDVKRAAERWSAATLPTMVKLARRTDQYATDVVPDWLRSMQQCLNEFDGRHFERVQEIFERLMAEILAETGQNEGLAAAVARDLAEIDRLFQLLPLQEREYIAQHGRRPGPERIPPDKVDSISKMSEVANQIERLQNPPGVNIERIEGGWGALRDELRQFEATLREAGAEREPFVMDLDLEVALIEWNQLAEDARVFVNSAGNF